MRLLLLVPVVLLLAACAGSSQTPTTSTPQSGPPTTEPGPPSVEVSRAPGRSVPVRPTAIMPVAPGTGPVVPVSQIDATAAQQLFGGTVRTDLSGTELQVQGVQDECSKVTAALTSQTAEAVTIRLLRMPTASQCPKGSPLIPVELTIDLARPLGGRTVILTQLDR